MKSHAQGHTAGKEWTGTEIRGVHCNHLALLIHRVYGSYSLDYYICILQYLLQLMRLETFFMIPCILSAQAVNSTSTTHTVLLSLIPFPSSSQCLSSFASRLKICLPIFSLCLQESMVGPQFSWILLNQNSWLIFISSPSHVYIWRQPFASFIRWSVEWMDQFIGLFYQLSGARNCLATRIRKWIPSGPVLRT